MGKDLFNEKKSRFSLRKLNIGVCSVLLGTLIMIGGTAQADENTETTAAPITPVAEAGETTASLVETRTVAETTPAVTNPVASATAATSAFVHVVRFLLQHLHLQQKHLLRMYQLQLKLVRNMLRFVQMRLQLLR